MTQLGQETADFIVIGAGIAGASISAHLAENASVILLEMESQPGYHTTGRSAALFLPGYGPQVIRSLTRAARSDLEMPMDGFSDTPLVSGRGAMFIASETQLKALSDLNLSVGDEVPMSRLDADQARDINPLLREGYTKAALFDPSCRDIDVHGLLQSYLRLFRRRRGQVLANHEVVRLRRSGGVWQVTTNKSVLSSGFIVNAAGAWADVVGQMAGAAPIGLKPLRRTVAVVKQPDTYADIQLPVTIDCEERFYVKPDAGRLLVSPADATPCACGDVRPEELDVAIGIDRAERACRLEVRRVEASWAGLRCFVADGYPVCGYDPEIEGLFWLAGLGGYGIQISPALSRLGAALAQKKAVPEDILNSGLEMEKLVPRHTMD